MLRELRDALAREDAAAVRGLADGYGAAAARPERRRRGAFADAARRSPPRSPGTPCPLPARQAPCVDPACGPGALLRAAFARLVGARRALGAALPALHGVDADPVAAALCRAVLAVDALEAGSRGPCPRSSTA